MFDDDEVAFVLEGDADLSEEGILLPGQLSECTQGATERTWREAMAHKAWAPFLSPRAWQGPR